MLLVRISVAAALGVALLAPSARAASPTDEAFVAKVSQGGMFEVKLGQVAADQGSTQDLRDQGNTEMHDHTLVGDKLKSLANGIGITFPNTLKAQFQDRLDRLRALSGRAFDSGYLRAMEDIHAKDGAAFAAEARNGSDPKLRAFAAETHRIVERHVGELKAIGPARD
ncbi:DUF4142 domain-containing protein [Lichenicoccus sp.]|uniref:DUF4142 domain-containing protein n=1 Tax=Lichenicoccus sp. TaxID=2781899 RepID=UPI003D10AB04